MLLVYSFSNIVFYLQTSRRLFWSCIYDECLQKYVCYNTIHNTASSKIPPTLISRVTDKSDKISTTSRYHVHLCISIWRGLLIIARVTRSRPHTLDVGSRTSPSVVYHLQPLDNPSQMKLKRWKIENAKCEREFQSVLEFRAMSNIFNTDVMTVGAWKRSVRVEPRAEGASASNVSVRGGNFRRQLILGRIFQRESAWSHSWEV